ncbi:rRNA maturation RNase YbeY [Candidatus Nucleicultrix amoebiphila]|jgi:probable rRNA maturation factor|uniref:rRNA maturation RNase YbeY n=1 Tax=Candidatus Nucleicultrix amoebiphila TaxID=1509244 RepID=UPI000A272825|nr:rRNA maturation RNase YbeY [Candidatus Nucleicultrix amoebiphila]
MNSSNQQNENIVIDIACDDEKWSVVINDYEAIIQSRIRCVLEQVVPWLKNVEVSVYLTNNVNVQRLNKDYRHKDHPTNVLSFGVLNRPLKAGDLKNSKEPFFLGDVVLSYGVIQQEALEQNKNILDHLSHLLVHGVLHLLGYDHEDREDAENMENLEIDILKKFSIKNPYECRGEVTI